MKNTKSKSKSSSSRKPCILWFDELSMKEAERASKAGTIVIVPVGSVEEHGDHLPLSTDSIQPEFVALEVAKRTGCLVAPPLRYGVCNSTRNFPGTLTITFEALHKIMSDILEELVRNGFMRILVMSGHAGQSHMAALKLAAQKVMWRRTNDKQEMKPRIMVCSDYDFAYELRGKYFDENDGHAGTIETSRVMSIRPDLVKKKGEKGYPKLPRFEIVDDLKPYFPSGVMGDPTAASAKKGQMINRHIIEEVTKLVEELKK